METDPLRNLGAMLAAGRAQRRAVGLAPSASPQQMLANALTDYTPQNVQGLRQDPEMLAQALELFGAQGLGGVRSRSSLGAPALAGQPPPSLTPTSYDWTNTGSDSKKQSGIVGQSEPFSTGLTWRPLASGNDRSGLGSAFERGLGTPNLGGVQPTTTPSGLPSPSTIATPREDQRDVTPAAGGVGPTVGDPLIARMAPVRPNDPFGFVVPPNTGKLMKPVGGDPFNPAALVPVSPQEKQNYLEWLVGAGGNYVPGVTSPEERFYRDQISIPDAFRFDRRLVSSWEERQIQDYAYLQDPRVRAFLDEIAKSEGGQYNILYQGYPFSDYSKYPDIFISGSSPAGRYQINSGTYREFAPRIGVNNFTPATQDLLATEILNHRGPLNYLLRGDLSGAIKKAAETWASLPGGKKQHVDTSQFLQYYQDALRQNTSP